MTHSGTSTRTGVASTIATQSSPAYQNRYVNTDYTPLSEADVAYGPPMPSGAFFPDLKSLPGALALGFFKDIFNFFLGYGQLCSIIVGTGLILRFVTWVMGVLLRLFTQPIVGNPLLHVLGAFLPAFREFLRQPSRWCLRFLRDRAEEAEVRRPRYDGGHHRYAQPDQAAREIEGDGDEQSAKSSSREDKRARFVKEVSQRTAAETASLLSNVSKSPPPDYHRVAADTLGQDHPPAAEVPDRELALPSRAEPTKRTLFNRFRIPQNSSLTVGPGSAELKRRLQEINQDTEDAGRLTAATHISRTPSGVKVETVPIRVQPGASSSQLDVVLEHPGSASTSDAVTTFESGKKPAVAPKPQSPPPPRRGGSSLT